MQAFGITEEDVETVLKAHWARVANTEGHSCQQPGAIKLRLADGSPAYLPTREEVVQQCRLSGLFEVKEGNPAGLAEGVLVEFPASSYRTQEENESLQSAASQFQSPHQSRPRG